MKAFLLSLLAKIKTMSLAMKITTSIVTVVIVSGGATAIIMASNPDLREDIGHFFRQETEQEIIETEEIPFEEKEELDDTRYEGETEVKQEGVLGEKRIQYRVILDKDGNEIFREKLSEETTKEPIVKITIVGTKKKEEESQKVQQESGAPSNTNNNASSSNTYNQQSVEDKCKTRIVGWDRPANCPTQSRAEYTALGGWELLIRNNYESLKSSGYKSTAVEGLCYGGLSIDLETMTISNVHWSNQPTSTCDAVRNENPPLPSAEYLTNYLRSIAK